MNRVLIIAFLALAMLIPAVVIAAAAPLTVTVANVGQGGGIPADYAKCVPDAAAHTRPGNNASPAISWEPGPAVTRSYAIIMHDDDVPVDKSLANKDSASIPANAPRQRLYHWVLVDIPANVTSIAAGAESQASSGTRLMSYGMRGQNDIMHAGYDGPCPPWNDMRVHRYHFTVYALDVPSLGLTGDFGGRQALAAMNGHVLAQGSVTGTFTQRVK